jgi:hypothetical protein
MMLKKASMPFLDAHRPWRAPFGQPGLPKFAPGKLVNVACEKRGIKHIRMCVILPGRPWPV